MRRALITGANGVIGRWLVEALLARGVAVTVLRRSSGRPSALELDGLQARCSVVDGDVCDLPEVMDAVAGHDTVFHLAAQSAAGRADRRPLETFEVNVRGTWNVLEACRLTGVERVVVASSEKVYGTRGAPPHVEAAALDAIQPYDVSKACAELVTRSYCLALGLPAALVRASNVYGPGDFERSRLVPELVGSVVAGRAPVLRSDGSPERAYLYAEDAAAAYLAVADAIGAGAEGEAFNVGGDAPHAVREVVGLLLEVAGTDVVAEYRGAPVPPEELDRQWIDSSKLRELTGWAPRVPLPEGLRRTVAWARSHPETWSTRDPDAVVLG